MKTTEKDMEFLYSYMTARKVDYTVDRNPTQEKIELVKQAIQRKNTLIKRAIEKYTGSFNTKVNA